MDSATLVAVVSIATAGITTGFGCMGPALGEGRSVASAMTSLAQQPDAAPTITRRTTSAPAFFPASSSGERCSST